MSTVQKLLVIILVAGFVKPSTQTELVQLTSSQQEEVLRTFNVYRKASNESLPCLTSKDISSLKLSKSELKNRFLAYANKPLETRVVVEVKGIVEGTLSQRLCQWFNDAKTEYNENNGDGGTCGAELCKDYLKLHSPRITSVGCVLVQSDRVQGFDKAGKVLVCYYAGNTEPTGNRSCLAKDPSCCPYAAPSPVVDQSCGGGIDKPSSKDLALSAPETQKPGDTVPLRDNVTTITTTTTTIEPGTTTRTIIITRIINVPQKAPTPPIMERDFQIGLDPSGGNVDAKLTTTQPSQTVGTTTEDQTIHVNKPAADPCQNPGLPSWLSPCLPA